MRKLIALIAIFALTATAAFAAVENIKVSGDYTALGVSRDYTLGVNTSTDEVSALASVTNLRFDADLTEDVMFTAVLTDERAWGSDAADQLYTSQAYATLKDFLSYPVTLKIGVQPVFLGSGLVVADPDTNREGGGALTGVLGDLSPRKSFAGMLAVVDLDPAMLTLGWIKEDESTLNMDDDVNAYIVNLGYNFEDYNTMAEVYGVWADEEGNGTEARERVDVYGLRSVSTLLDSLTLSGEFAYQVKKDFRGDNTDASDRAFRLAADYAFLDADYAPTIGFDYVNLSENWSPMYEGWTPANIANKLFTNSNVELYGLTFTAEPREDMSASLRYAYLKAASKPGVTAYQSDYATYVVKADEDDLGSELDFALTYDYTEDVQFGFNFDYFMPGDWFDGVNDDEAYQALGSMKVSF